MRDEIELDRGVAHDGAEGGDVTAVVLDGLRADHGIRSGDLGVSVLPSCGRLRDAGDLPDARLDSPRIVHDGDRRPWKGGGHLAHLNSVALLRIPHCFLIRTSDLLDESTSFATSTRAASVAAGIVTVTVTTSATVDGKAVSTERNIPYAARSCR